MPELGDSIHGRLDTYTISKLLVQGRFGATYKALRSRDGVEVIAKTIVRDQALLYDVREVFDRLVERLRRLDHEGVAGYLDGATISFENTLVLFQEYAKGRTLKACVEEDGPMTHAKALPWFMRVLAILEYVHAQSPPIIHGDLDWGNIFVDDETQHVQLVDFATARQAILEPSELSAGMVTGALDFAPMEQLLGQIFLATDLYALAMTYLATTTGLEPRDFAQQGLRVDVDKVVPRGTPEAFVTLLKQMTDPDAQKRLDNAAIVLERVRAQRFLVTQQAQGNDHEQKDEPFKRRVSKEEEHDGLQAQGRKDERVHELLCAFSVRSLSWFEVLKSHDAFNAPPKTQYDRVYAFGINTDATHVLVVHKHMAILLSTDDWNPRGRFEFEEIGRRAAISRDGKKVAVLTGFEDLLCFDVQFSVWQRHHITVRGMWPGNSQLVFSPDGERVAISDDDQVNIYSWSDGALVHRHDVDGQFGLTFSPSGLFLCAQGEQAITKLEAFGVTETWHDDGMAFSPDGKMLAITKGDTVRLGPYHEDAMRMDWAHDMVKLEGTTGRLNMVAWSPNQRLLLVAGSGGCMRLVDVDRRKVLPWNDARADDLHKVKIFSIGFSPDSRTVLVHAHMTPDDFESEKMGTVLSFSCSGGRMLGSMRWMDETLMMQSRSGFFGSVHDLDTGSFSNDMWARPRVALAEFMDRDLEGLLGPKDRVAVREFLARREVLQQAHAWSSERWELWPVLDAVSGVSHVLPKIFERAFRASNAQQERGGMWATTTLTEYLVEAAQWIRDEDEEYRHNLFEQILREEGVSTSTLKGGLFDFEGSVYDSDAKGSVFDLEEEELNKTKNLNGFMGVGRLAGNSQGSWEIAQPTKGRSELVHADQEPGMARTVDTSFRLLPWSVSLALGFMPVFLTLYILGAATLSSAEFVGVLCAGPIIAAVFYLLLLRPKAAVF